MTDQKPYVSPQLLCVGRVEELTQTGGRKSKHGWGWGYGHGWGWGHGGKFGKSKGTDTSTDSGDAFS
jgi:hypothetical protein